MRSNSALPRRDSRPGQRSFSPSDPCRFTAMFRPHCGDPVRLGLKEGRPLCASAEVRSFLPVYLCFHGPSLVGGFQSTMGGGGVLRASRKGKPWAFFQLRCVGLAQALGLRAARAQGSEEASTHGCSCAALTPPCGSRHIPIVIPSALLGYFEHDQNHNIQQPAGTAITRWHVSTLPRSDQLIFTSYSGLDVGPAETSAVSGNGPLEPPSLPRGPVRHITRG